MGRFCPWSYFCLIEIISPIFLNTAAAGALYCNWKCPNPHVTNMNPPSSHQVCIKFTRSAPKRATRRCEKKRMYTKQTKLNQKTSHTRDKPRVKVHGYTTVQLKGLQRLRKGEDISAGSRSRPKTWKSELYRYQAALSGTVFMFFAIHEITLCDYNQMRKLHLHLADLFQIGHLL